MSPQGRSAEAAKQRDGCSGSRPWRTGYMTPYDPRVAGKVLRRNSPTPMSWSRMPCSDLVEVGFGSSGFVTCITSKLKDTHPKFQFSWEEDDKPWDFGVPNFQTNPYGCWVP